MNIDALAESFKQLIKKCVPEDVVNNFGEKEPYTFNVIFLKYNNGFTFYNPCLTMVDSGQMIVPIDNKEIAQIKKNEDMYRDLVEKEQSQ